jgi:hypothetical protein
VWRVCYLAAADLEPILSGGQLGYARPRTQDSSFSLDGGGFGGEGQGSGARGAELGLHYLVSREPVQLVMAASVHACTALLQCAGHAMQGLQVAEQRSVCVLLLAGGINAERAGSGDSLTSLPKLQPVHRLAKPDLKIVKRIGEGAFGEVSVAKAPLYGTVAVKWLKVCLVRALRVSTVGGGLPAHVFSPTRRLLQVALQNSTACQLLQAPHDANG